MGKHTKIRPYLHDFVNCQIKSTRIKNSVGKFRIAQTNGISVTHCRVVEKGRCNLGMAALKKKKNILRKFYSW